MVRNFLSLSTLCVVLLLLSCTAENPFSPGEETGSLAPQILYKTASGQAVTLPAEILSLARTVRVAVTPSGRASIEKIVPFIAHGVVIDAIPAGSATLLVQIRDQYDQPISTGSAMVNIIAGQTVQPVVIADIAPPKQPLVTVSQVCDFGVRISWLPCGLANNMDLTVERNTGGANWENITDASPFYESNGDFFYNAARNHFEILDTFSGYAAGSLYRFKLAPYYYRGPGDWVPGVPSNWVSLNIGSGFGGCGMAVEYNYGGWVYGQVGTTYLKLFRAPDSGLPPLDALPGTPLAADTVYYTPVTPSVKFFFPSLLPGRYWLYAFSSPADIEDWQTSFKRAIYNVQMDKHKSNQVIQLDFNRVLFPTGKTLAAGYPSGALNSENIMEIGWWNEAELTEYFLGFYWVGGLDSLTVQNFPSLSDLATYFGGTHDAVDDDYTLYFWNDADMSGSFNTGDPYYYDEDYFQNGHYLGDMTYPKYVGGLAYNRTNTGSGKRQVLPKKIVLR